MFQQLPPPGPCALIPVPSFPCNAGVLAGCRAGVLARASLLLFSCSLAPLFPRSLTPVHWPLISDL
jgi:hypothetical protein